MQLSLRMYGLPLLPLDACKFGMLRSAFLSMAPTASNGANVHLHESTAAAAWTTHVHTAASRACCLHV